MKLPRLTVNLYKVVIGVGFSLLWASIMYIIWPQPSYVTFIWFYLGLGSIVLKWVIFEIIDRINMKLRLRGVKRELEESLTRANEVSADTRRFCERQTAVSNVSSIGLDVELKQLQEELLSMASMVEKATERAVESLMRKDMVLARGVIEEDPELDLKQIAVRDHCTRVIASSCPQANDLGFIVAALGISIDLERMGDYAEGIAKITLMIGNQPHLAPPLDITLMAQKGIEMLQGSLGSFLDRDVDKARRIFQTDDEVDKLHDVVFRELIQVMIENPELIAQANWLVWVAYDLERFADKVTDICEWVAFGAGSGMVDASLPKH